MEDVNEPFLYRIEEYQNNLNRKWPSSTISKGNVFIDHSYDPTCATMKKSATSDEESVRDLAKGVRLE